MFVPIIFFRDVKRGSEYCGDGIQTFSFEESFKSSVYFLLGRKKLYALINIYKSSSS